MNRFPFLKAHRTTKLLATFAWCWASVASASASLLPDHVDIQLKLVERGRYAGKPAIHLTWDTTKYRVPGSKVVGFQILINNNLAHTSDSLNNNDTSALRNTGHQSLLNKYLTRNPGVPQLRNLEGSQQLSDQPFQDVSGDSVFAPLQLRQNSNYVFQDVSVLPRSIYVYYVQVVTDQGGGKLGYSNELYGMRVTTGSRVDMCDPNDGCLIEYLERGDEPVQPDPSADAPIPQDPQNPTADEGQPLDDGTPSSDEPWNTQTAAIPPVVPHHGANLLVDPASQLEPAVRKYTQRGFQLVFSDEFDDAPEPGGNWVPRSPNPDRWNSQLMWGPDVIVNNELQHYVDTMGGDTSFNPFQIQGGVLSILAKPAQRGNQKFLSGVLTTYKKFWDDDNLMVRHIPNFAATHGIFEARIRFPQRKDGDFPAFWMVHVVQSGGDQYHPGSGNLVERTYGKTYAGEIDIIEFPGVHPRFLYTTTHHKHGSEYVSLPKPGWEGHNEVDLAQFENPNTGLPIYPNDTIKEDGEAAGLSAQEIQRQRDEFFEANRKFHTYRVEWNEDPSSSATTHVKWFIDDALVKELDNPGMPNEPLYMVLNYAIGGSWPGQPDMNQWNQQGNIAAMEIDWVRAYQSGTPEIQGEALIRQNAVKNPGSQ